MAFIKSFIADLAAAGAKHVTAAVLRFVAVVCLIWIFFDAPWAVGIALACFFIAWLLTRDPADTSPLPGVQK